MTEKLWYKVANNFVRAGRLPVPINEPMIEILKTILTEEQAKFLLIFKERSYTLEQIKSKTDLDDESLKQMLKVLMHVGAITGIPSSQGLMIYRIPPFLPGLLEFTMMRGERSEKDLKLAKLHQEYFNEFVQGTQKNYDQITTLFEKAPSIARVIPVEEEIEVRQEIVLPLEELSKIIEKYDTIGLSTCYCRHRKDLLDSPCKKTEDRKNCFSFGKTATFLISEGFAERISKEEAMKILKKCEDDGLVHKAFHTHLDPMREIDGLCNCCKCCCGTFELYYEGGTPLLDMTSYMANVNEEECIGCGTCVEECNSEAIDLVDTFAVINESRCIGCGICAHLCPENAIKLNRTELRDVKVPPPKLKNV
jgi:ferredoxin